MVEIGGLLRVFLRAVETTQRQRSPGDGTGGAEFHPATELDTTDITTVQAKIRNRGLRWLHRHGHLDDVS